MKDKKSPHPAYIPRTSATHLTTHLTTPPHTAGHSQSLSEIIELAVPDPGDERRNLRARVNERGT